MKIIFYALFILPLIKADYIELGNGTTLITVDYDHCPLGEIYDYLTNDTATILNLMNSYNWTNMTYDDLESIKNEVEASYVYYILHNSAGRLKPSWNFLLCASTGTLILHDKKITPLTVTMGALCALQGVYAKGSSGGHSSGGHSSSSGAHESFSGGHSTSSYSGHSYTSSGRTFRSNPLSSDEHTVYSANSGYAISSRSHTGLYVYGIRYGGVETPISDTCLVQTVITDIETTLNISITTLNYGLNQLSGLASYLFYNQTQNMNTVKGYIVELQNMLEASDSRMILPHSLFILLFIFLLFN